MKAKSLTEDDEAWGRLLVCVFDNETTWHQEGGGQMLTYKIQQAGGAHTGEAHQVINKGGKQEVGRRMRDEKVNQMRKKTKEDTESIG